MNLQGRHVCLAEHSGCNYQYHRLVVRGRAAVCGRPVVRGGAVTRAATGEAGRRTPPAAGQYLAPGRLRASFMTPAAVLYELGFVARVPIGR